MVDRIWVNTILDPNATQSSGGFSTLWSFGGGNDDGTGAGGNAIASSGTGPIPEISTYVQGTSGVWGGGVDFLSVSAGFGAPAPGTVGYIDVIPGERNYFGMYVWTSVPGATASIGAFWYEGTSVFLGENQAPASPIASGAWQLISSSFVAPSNATRVGIAVRIRRGDAAKITVGAVVRGTSAASIASVGGVDYDGVPFNGAWPDSLGVVDYSWAGTVNNSSSRAVVVVPDQVVFAPMDAVAVPVPDPVSPRRFKQLNLNSFTVVEDSTPVDASDSTGGTGQFTLGVDENDETPYLVDVPIDLIDPAQGTTRGFIRNLSSDNTSTTLAADSRMVLLSVERSIPPFNGNLGDYFESLLEACSITSGLVIDASLYAVPVTFPGWRGNVWTKIKTLLPIHQLEASLVSNNVVIRPVRERTAERYRDSSRSWAVDTTQKARAIEIYRYTNTQVTNGLIYPTGGWNPEVAVYDVAAGVTIEVDLEVDASVTSINQPTAVDYVASDFTGASVYAVTGNDNLPVPAAQWLAQGGSVTIEITDTFGLRAVIKGASLEQYAPYRIALSSGANNFYSTLRLIGTGVTSTRVVNTYQTYVNPDRVTQDIGVTIENEFIDSDQKLHDVKMWALKRWGDDRRTISVGTVGINRLGDNGSYRYATIGEFNDYAVNESLTTIGDFNSFYTGQTIGDFNQFWIDRVSNDFANQAFGNISGARTLENDAWFRIRSANVDAAGVTYQAEDDTTIGDFNFVWAGATIADFNAEWSGEIIKDFNAKPLRRTNA